LLLVAGMRKTQRVKLRAAGVETIEQLAASSGPVETFNPMILDSLRAQASLQIAPPTIVEDREIPAFEIIGEGKVILNLPTPSAGDIFFDFEGDPLWSDVSGTDWGLEYLFGVIEPDGDGVFRPWWAHNREQEKQTLTEFLDYVQDRRTRHPDMHVYHYAPYEVTALKRLVGRFGVYEDVLDDMLRNGVFIDLYQTVRQGLRAGTRSYSIKKLEPLYRGDELREGLDNAADSIVEYQRYTDQILDDNEAEAAKTLAGIADYNRYDCLSTWRLRDWLRDQVDGGGNTVKPQGDEPGSTGDTEVGDSIDELAPVMGALLAHAGELGHRTSDEQAAAMVAASLGYHRREHKPFWWAYFDRLTGWPGDWLEPRDCLHAHRVEVVVDWHKEGRKDPARLLRLLGRLDVASSLTVGSSVKGIYDDVPFGFEQPEVGGRCVGGGATIEDVTTEADGTDILVVRERQPKGTDAWQELPIGVCVASPIPTKSIEETLLKLARDVVDGLPEWSEGPGLDILRRVPPRFTSGGLAPIDVDPADAIYDSLMNLDRSYLAVQGPPGTGKTFVGSQVITKLVKAGWRIGVVAQSHAVVENFLRAAVDAGLSPDLIAKPHRAEDAPWAELNGDKLHAFIDAHDATGC
ncbi:MAG: TM0106 family RecB-like putative nuclease, partial [Aeromicrobium sp.]